MIRERSVNNLYGVHEHIERQGKPVNKILFPDNYEGYHFHGNGKLFLVSKDGDEPRSHQEALDACIEQHNALPWGGRSYVSLCILPPVADGGKYRYHIDNLEGSHSEIGAILRENGLTQVTSERTTR